MCSWCHCHLLSPTARCCVCFCTEAAGQGTPHLPLHSQVTLSNHSSDQRGKTRAYRHLVNTRVTFTHERQSCGRQPGDTRGGGFSATGPGAKWFVVGITGAPTLLQKPQHCCHGCSRNCCGKSTGERGGVTATKAPSLHQDGSPGLNFSTWRMKRRVKSTTESHVF